MKFPSYTSAILAGAVGMPLLILGINYIKNNFGSQFLQLVWFIICFFLPLLISTADLGYIRRRLQEGHTLYILIRLQWARTEDFKRFYIPTWKRMLVYFVSACISTLLLKLIAIDFG